jgi:hypothetical protein
MTIIDASQLLELVDPPAVVPLRFGLFSVVDFRPAERLPFAVVWESDTCADVTTTNDVCVLPAQVDPTLDDACYTESAPGFAAVYLYGASLGGQGLDYHEGKARARFTNGEQVAVETELAAQLAVAPTVIAPVTSLILALGALELAIGQNVHNEGVIHMSRSAAVQLGDHLDTSGSRLRTKLGTPVVAGGGYHSMGLTSMYATGPLVGERGELLVSSTVDRRTNGASVLVERPYMIGWDCGAWRVTVS